jgi:hypothetical protein
MNSKLFYSIISTVYLIYGSVTLSCQTYRYVSNTGMAAPQHYLTLQTALDSSQSGDIILLAPSPNTYAGAGITINKKVTIIGAGFRITQNPQLGISSILHETKIGAISINTAGEGAKIIGCRISSINATNVKKIEIDKCEIEVRIQFQNVDSSNIIGCYFTGNNLNVGILNDYRSNHLGISDNSTIIAVLNNLFPNASPNTIGCTAAQCFDNVYVSNNSNAIFENNLFTDVVNADNSIFVNNIFLSTSDNLNSPSSSSSASNNIFAVNETSYGTGNIINYGQNNICVGFPTQGSYTFDNRFALTPTSVAKSYGINGEDCGVFDGTNNYKLSGIPKRPIIHEFSIPDVSPTNGQLNIILKARKEN